MIRTVTLSALILYGIAAVTIMASAQQKDTDMLKFSGSVYGEWTDNRDSTPTPESNFDTYIKPRMDVHLTSEGGSVLDFHYAPYYRYRSNPSDIENQTELFHDLLLSLTHQPNPATTLRASDCFYRTDDPSVDQNGITLRRDCSYMLNYAEAGLNYQLSDRRTCLDVAGRDTVKRYDDSVVAAESDENNMGVCVTGWRQLQRTLAALVVLDVANFGYDDTLGIERDFNAISAGAGLEKVVSRNLSLNARAGLIAVNYKDPSLDSESQPFASLNIDANSTPQARLTASLTYLIRDSDVYPFPSEKCTQLDARMEWDYSELLTIGLGGTYRVGQFSQDTLTPEGLSYQEASGYALSGNEKTLVLGGDITYKMGLTTTLKLAQTREKVDSDVSESYTRNATGLTISQLF